MYNHKNVYHCHLIFTCYHSYLVFYFSFSYLFVCVCVCARASHGVHVEVRRQPKKVSSLLFFYHMAPCSPAGVLLELEGRGCEVFRGRA